MEYTKDIVLGVACKKEIGITKLKSWTSQLKKGVKDNKLIVTILTLLSTLMIIDIALVNCFLQLLSSIY